MGAPETEWRAPAKLAAGATVLGLYLIGGVAAFWSIWAHPATWQIQGGAGDPAQYDWFLAWTPWAIAHGHNPLVTHWANYPFGANLVSNTAMFGLALLMAPVTIIWGPVASLNVLFTLSFPLSAAAFYLLARRFVSWRPAAFAAGLLYGYSPYMVGQGSGHLNLVFVPLPPLILLVVHELLVRQNGSSRNWGILLGALIVGQFLISSEVLATTALFAAVTLVVLGLIDRSSVIQHLRRARNGLIMAVAVPLVLLIPPIYEEFFGAQHISARIAGYETYHSSLIGPFFPTPLIKFATARMKSIGARSGANNSENGTYLGVPLVALLVLAPILIRRRAVRIASLMTAIAYVLSLGVRLYIGVARYDHLGRHIPLPAVIIDKLPLISQAFPVRYALFVALFAALVFGLTLDILHDRPRATSRPTRSKPAWALPAVVAVVVLVPLVPAWPYAALGPVNVPKYFTTSAVDHLDPGTVTLVYPLAMNTDMSPMLWQAEAHFRFRMMGGYFLVPVPSGWQFYTPTTTESVLTALRSGDAPARSGGLRRQLVSEMESWGVKAIVAQPVGHDPIGFLTWLTGRRPDAAQGGMVEWYNLSWRQGA